MNQDVVHVALGDLLRAGPLVVYESFGNALHRFHNEPSFRVPIPARNDAFGAGWYGVPQRSVL